MTDFQHNMDEDVVEFLRQIADDIENGDAEAMSFGYSPNVATKDNHELNLEWR